jgi:hypothetical protein
LVARLTEEKVTVAAFAPLGDTVGAEGIALVAICVARITAALALRKPAPPSSRCDAVVCPEPVHAPAGHEVHPSCTSEEA